MTRVLLLDYDQTMYPLSDGALVELDRRINCFLIERFGLEQQAAETMRIALCREYGTTIRGLQLLHEIEPHGYYDFIHDVPSSCLPRPRDSFRSWLEGLDMPVHVFTNARSDWVEMGLRSMGLKLEQARIFDICFANWQGKPHDEVYRRVEEQLRQLHGPLESILMADDAPQNLVAAQSQGWRTAWIRHGRANSALPTDFAPDYIVDDLCELVWKA